MIRKTAFGLIAAAATLAAAMGATASTASAGAKFHFGFGGHGHGYGYGYHAPYYAYYAPHCKRVFVGYHKVWTHYGWVKEPIFKKVCY